VPVTESLLDHKVLDHKVLGREFKRGFAVGQARFLRRQLEYRYKQLPKWVADKLATATSAQIEEWAIRSFNKKSLKAIFDRD